jgi:hypothetical protein
MVSPMAEYNLMDPVIWGHLKEQIYAAPPVSMVYLLSGLQAVLTAVDANTFDTLAHSTSCNYTVFMV